MSKPKYPTIYVKVDTPGARKLEEFPNAGPRPSIIGMKERFWGTDALCIKCGQYVYKVDRETYRFFGGIVE